MSNDVLLENVFVPYDRAPAMPTARSTFHDTPPGLRLPTGTSFSPPCIVLGIAQAAIRDTITFANQSGMSYGGAPRSSTPGNQFAIADAAMAVESARAFFLQELTAVQEKGLRGIPFTARDGIRMRMAGHVVRQNSQMAVERLFVIRGAHGIYESDSFERNYRDVRVGTLPAPSAPDRVREQVGRFLFDPANAGDSRV
jgi:alkylation response protein AidB-like acyl-CoA dehydrogenase